MVDTEQEIMSADNPIAQGKRLKLLRNMLGLNQAEFAKALGYSRVSISYWENALYGGLTPQGAKSAIDVANKHDISCSLDWLILGEGHAPSYKLDPTKLSFANSTMNAISKINEIELFKYNHHGAVTLELNDDSMEPYFFAGQTVGGIWQSTEILSLSTKTNAIITIDGVLQTRQITKEDEKDRFLITITNKNSSTPFHSKIISLQTFAKVIRVWE